MVPAEISAVVLFTLSGVHGVTRIIVGVDSGATDDAVVVLVAFDGVVFSSPQMRSLPVPP